MVTPLLPFTPPPPPPPLPPPFSLSQFYRLKFCKDYDAYTKLHLSKTDCVRAFQLANATGHSDGDTHEMDLEEFCQCVLFLSKLAGFLGEGDKVPLASQCTLAVAESVSKLLTILGCIVPEIGNRSSRNLARMKRQGSKGKVDALVPISSRTQQQEQEQQQQQLPLAYVEEDARNHVLGSGGYADDVVVKEAEGIDSAQAPVIATHAASSANGSGSSLNEDGTDQSCLYSNADPSHPSGNMDIGVNHVALDKNDNLNGNLERAAISALQSDFRDMNLLPQQKWSHFASCLAQAGVNSLKDLLHLGSQDDVLVKFLQETCGMNVIQGKKVVAFVKAT